MSQYTAHGPWGGWVRQHRRLTAVLFGLAALAVVILWILAG